MKFGTLFHLEICNIPKDQTNIPCDSIRSFLFLPLMPLYAIYATLDACFIFRMSINIKPWLLFTCVPVLQFFLATLLMLVSIGQDPCTDTLHEHQ